jgi:hypothetical protein
VEDMICIHLYEKRKFKDSLEAISWPTPIKPPYEPELKQKLKKFEANFRHLIVLQQS